MAPDKVSLQEETDLPGTLPQRVTILEASVKKRLLGRSQGDCPMKLPTLRAKLTIAFTHIQDTVPIVTLETCDKHTLFLASLTRPMVLLQRLALQE